MKQFGSTKVSCAINMTNYPADTQDCINSYGLFPPSKWSKVRFTNITFTVDSHYEENTEFSIVSLEVRCIVSG